MSHQLSRRIAKYLGMLLIDKELDACIIDNGYCISIPLIKVLPQVGLCQAYTIEFFIFTEEMPEYITLELRLDRIQ